MSQTPPLLEYAKQVNRELALSRDPPRRGCAVLRGDPAKQHQAHVVHLLTEAAERCDRQELYDRIVADQTVTKPQRRFVHITLFGR